MDLAHSVGFMFACVLLILKHLRAKRAGARGRRPSPRLPLSRCISERSEPTFTIYLVFLRAQRARVSEAREAGREKNFLHCIYSSSRSMISMLLLSVGSSFTAMHVSRLMRLASAAR